MKIVSTNLSYKVIDVCLTATLLFVFGCKKYSDENISPSTGSRIEFTLDSLYLYAKDIYLWNDVLPSYSDFSPREKYAYIFPEINAVNNELFDLSQFKINEKTKLPYEYRGLLDPKYSYLETNYKQNTKATLSASGVVNSGIIVNHIDNLTYLYIPSFPPLNTLRNNLDSIFIDIAKQRPRTMVIDLRYNKGGYIETAEYLANLIGSSKLNGKIMYMECFNSTLSTGKAKILKHQPYLDINGNYVKINGRQATMADIDFSEKGNTYYFDKKGQLESIENIYFIISGSTASASELLISLFKPYYNVKLVGQKTFGKPVGFFPIEIDKYSIYLSSFLLKNAKGWFDYFDGIEPDIAIDLPISPELGDPEEVGLKNILRDLGRNKTSLSATNRKKYTGRNRHDNKIFDSDKEMPLIERRLKLTLGVETLNTQ
ncbi:S41 family peptidase [Sphingobacterium sp. G1-14]|uniref:S41 family peptidase n=1 Tax=Sphingobacterium sp. G1-14 TaxID=2003121 RepID=UPI000B4923A7|nr:S41 family peptidase [Sphingobacterium sp. G1-14]